MAALKREIPELPDIDAVDLPARYLTLRAPGLVTGLCDGNVQRIGHKAGIQNRESGQVESNHR